MPPATWTITFSESVENHAGMQTVGDRAAEGFGLDELAAMQDAASTLDIPTTLYTLDDALPSHLRDTATPAQALVLHGGLTTLLGAHYSAFLAEVRGTAALVDKKAWMRGRVVNKLARHNLCYGEEEQAPDYEAKKGTIIAFRDAPCVARLREALGQHFGARCTGLLAELNYYYDTSKCGIGFHGDSERRLVLGARVGESLPLHYQWYMHSQRVGERVEVPLHEGDLYIMSEKAVGTDWKCRNHPTLRHATGAAKYTK